MSITGFHHFARRLIVIISLVVGLAPLHPPQPAAAQAPWPPFWFDLIPAYADGRLTYQVALYTRVEAQLLDLAIKIPLPPGTRFVEANALPEVTSAFDGQELTFFTPALDRYIEGISFSLEVTDPAQRVITAQAWIAWKGTPAGDYLSDPVSIDITRQPLNWSAPGRSRLQLSGRAALAEDRLTLELYPRAVDREHMWDLSINLPLPQGTRLISADAPASFVTSFDGREVSFFTLELERQAEVGPLIIRLATQDVTDPTLRLPVYAAWKNGPAEPLPGAPSEPGKWWHGPAEELPAAPAEEQITLEWSLAQPHVAQRAVFDAAGDVPFAEYDLTGIAFQELGPMLLVSFETAGEVGQAGAPVEFSLFVDADCDSTTGERRVFRGAEYQVRYNHESGRAIFIAWDPAAADWDWAQGVVLDSLLDSRRVVASIPRSLLGAGGDFCWVARAAHRTAAFYPDPPQDWLPDEPHLQLTRYEMAAPAAPLAGLLAVALPDEANEYTVYVFSLPDGNEMATIPNARHPEFQPGGQSLLVSPASSSARQVVETHSADGKTAVVVLKTFGQPLGMSEYYLAGERKVLVSESASPHAPGDLITFMPSPEGDWEVYVMDPHGTDLRNVSNSPASQDGLPALSPDGNWVAFVSDRDGGWAVWAAPVTRGPAHKLLDLPVDIPWGPDDPAWAAERLSWGP